MTITFTKCSDHMPEKNGTYLIIDATRTFYAIVLFATDLSELTSDPYDFPDWRDYIGIPGFYQYDSYFEEYEVVHADAWAELPSLTSAV